MDARSWKCWSCWKVMGLLKGGMFAAKSIKQELCGWAAVCDCCHTRSYRSPWTLLSPVWCRVLDQFWTAMPPVSLQNIMIDCGKQRMQKYIAKCFAPNSKHTKQFLSEKKKMEKMMETSGTSPNFLNSHYMFYCRNRWMLIHFAEHDSHNAWHFLFYSVVQCQRRMQW